jgi:urea transport system substrate-binding protein
MKRWLLGLSTLIVLGSGAWIAWILLHRNEAPIRVGILHSKTGPLAISEQSMIDAELMALDEINQRGGLLGRRIEPVIADGQSDPKIFAQEARRLIESDRVCVIVGGWTSLSRRSIKSVVEPAGHLLIFPSNYEGMDLTSSIVCTGPIPNQQVIPAVNWCFQTLEARKFFLAGSQDILSYSSNAIIKDQLKALGAECTGEKYVPLDGGEGMTELIGAIKAVGPDIVLSTVIGDGNKQFYEQMAQAGLSPSQLPVLSFSIGEDEIRDLPVKEMIGDFAAWSYFESIDSPVNRAFVQRYKERYGSERTTGDAIVASYNGVMLWAKAVAECGTESTSEVRRAIRRQSLEAPEGIISVDSDTLHTWRPFYLGKIREDGQFEIVWSLEKPVRPVPYPVLRSQAEWAAFIGRLYATWGSHDLNSHKVSDTGESDRALTGRQLLGLSKLSLRGARQERHSLQ